MKDEISGKVRRSIIGCFVFLGVFNFSGAVWAQPVASGEPTVPKIVNIVNFIRLLEPRDPAITEDVLYQTVVEQIAIMRKYHLGGTFLLQYDALIDPRYQTLLRSLPGDSFEIGAWWELPQPLIEKAGMQWRGRYPWDWHANVGFVTGYTPSEREKLIDVYMQDFKKIFGYYPKSVGSWFIDAHSLSYMYEKYHIVASSNCKDQYGTDGYTLWGGYWNQAYYPSKINSYMPAQTAQNQVPVPVFRMLGSDPIRQYDNGLGLARQGVITIEPVYKFGGGDSTWVKWFLTAFTNGPELGFNYTQVGQENSFTWKNMAKGFEIQMPMIARLRDEHKLTVETMAASGNWFKKQFKVTPTTTFTVTRDLDSSDCKTIWFNSRFYRTNIIWEKGTLRIRDIHLFNEHFPSRYETSIATSNECSFFTLPFVDGYLWSKPGQLAGLRLKALINGEAIQLEGGDPEFVPVARGKEISRMHISWPMKTVKGKFEIDLNEQQLVVKWQGEPGIDWYLELNTAKDVPLPFKKVDAGAINCQFENMNYRIRAEKGTCSQPGNGAVLHISQQGGSIVLNFSSQE
ncbi:hypothetical protein A3860_22450 [Niastella vici]|uniref:Uncharacterized protein n=1 Tax=Niastella vici TaxID=1703345 RepID=A0A1V9G0M0_9BACT|nr:hypothetical protein [Niastella vici]OQP64169.1 hypothetical protein A3860_22450 [Niastella vici]